MRSASRLFVAHSLWASFAALVDFVAIATITASCDAVERPRTFGTEQDRFLRPAAILARGYFFGWGQGAFPGTLQIAPNSCQHRRVPLTETILA